MGSSWEWPLEDLRAAAAAGEEPCRWGGRRVELEAAAVVALEGVEGAANWSSFILFMIRTVQQSWIHGLRNPHKSGRFGLTLHDLL